MLGVILVGMCHWQSDRRRSADSTFHPQKRPQKGPEIRGDAVDVTTAADSRDTPSRV
jgi:hypothetical protein